MSAAATKPVAPDVDVALFCADPLSFVGKRVTIALSAEAIGARFSCTRKRCREGQPACACNTCSAQLTLDCSPQLRIDLRPSVEGGPVIECAVEGCDASCTPGIPTQLTALTGTLSQLGPRHVLALEDVSLDPNRATEARVRDFTLRQRTP